MVTENLNKKLNLRARNMSLVKNSTKNSSNSNKPTIVVMTRWHAIYRCKSRLSKEIGAHKAAKIQEQLTQHTVNVAKEIQKEGIADIKVALDGIGLKAAKRWANLNEIKAVSTQGSGNLGTKMKRQLLKTLADKTISQKRISNPILLIGTDLPTISTFDLRQALEILNHKDLVLGPSTDGGYWLIGLSNKLLNPLTSWPFSGISWGTNKVLKETIQLAFINKIDYHLLQIKNDIDNLIDLSPWLDQKKFLLSAQSYQL